MNTPKLADRFKVLLMEGIAPITDAEFMRIVKLYHYLMKRKNRNQHA